MPTDFLFSGWAAILRTLLLGAAAYLALVVILRLSGKRTLSKLNAFDLVVTVALGSTLATILLNRNVSLAEGVVALALLVFLQYAVTWTSVRWSGFGHAVRSEPTLLLKDGQPLPQAMRKERVTEAELASAVRSSGGRELSDAQIVVLESDGTLSVSLRS